MFKLSENKTYFELNYPQRHVNWFNARKFRVTASSLEVIVTSKSQFCTIEQEIKKVEEVCAACHAKFRD